MQWQNIDNWDYSNLFPLSYTVGTDNLKGQPVHVEVVITLTLESQKRKITRERQRSTLGFPLIYKGSGGSRGGARLPPPPLIFRPN